MHFLPIEKTYLEIVAGSVLLFPKCHLNRTTPEVSLTKFDIFWVKNDVFIISSTEEPVLENEVLLFPTFRIQRSILSDVGVYQCAVQIVDKMEQPMLSDKFEVKIKRKYLFFDLDMQANDVHYKA